MTDTIIAVALIGISLLFLLLAGLARATRRTMPAPPNAARPVATPQPPVGRAHDACMVIGCPNPWEVAVAGWLTCRAHDARRPYDLTTDAGSVIEAAREITKRAAS